MKFVYVEFDNNYRTYCKVRRKITRFKTGKRQELEITPFTFSDGKREYYKAFYVPMNMEGWEYRIDRE